MKRFFWSCFLGLAIPFEGSAIDPTWWRLPLTRIVNTGSSPSHYSPANIGQLKHVAMMARLHLEEKLPGGAGPEIDALVNSFGMPSNLTPVEAEAWRRGNFAPINLGQLKAVAKPFYDRLAEVQYDTRANLIAHGYSASWPVNNPYPWNPATPIEQIMFLPTWGS